MAREIAAVERAADHMVSGGVFHQNAGRDESIDLGRSADELVRKRAANGASNRRELSYGDKDPTQMVSKRPLVKIGAG
jgi:hypothetical protein